MKHVFAYFRESWQELGKISWPNRDETIRLTIAVLIFSVVFAAFSGAADFGLTRLLKVVLE